MLSDSTRQKLQHMSLAQMADEGRVFLRRRRSWAADTVSFGNMLVFIDEQKRYREDGFDTLSLWCKDRLDLTRDKTVDGYLALGRLPLRLVQDREIDVGSLALIGRQWPWMQGLLCELFDGAEKKARKQIRQALETVAPYLRSLGCQEPALATAEQIERACAYLRGVVAGTVTSYRAPEAEQEAKPQKTSDMGRTLARGLSGLAVLVAMLLVRKGEGAEMKGQWTEMAWAVLRELVFKVAALLGKEPAELLRERREAERGGGAGRNAPAEEKGKEDEGMEEETRRRRGPGQRQTSTGTVLSVVPPEGAGDGLSSRGEEPGKPKADEGTGASPPPRPAEEPPAAPPEEWHVPVTRAVVAHATPEEVPLLEGHLVRVLSGCPPVELLSFVRTIGQRMADVPRPVRDDLGCWLRAVAHRDLEVRWPYVYNFFTTAQLPGFRTHLHALGRVELPAALRQALEAAWAYWPVELEGPPLPQATNEEEAEMLAFVRAELLFQQAYGHFRAGEGEVSVIPLSWMWCEAVDLKKALQKLLDQEEAEDPPGPE